MDTTSRKYDTRTVMELSVGTSYMVELVIHMRSADLDWWNNDVSKHEAELMTVISRKIISQEEVFRNEILNTKKKRDEGGDKKVVIGEKNFAASRKANDTLSTNGYNKSNSKAKRNNQAAVAVVQTNDIVKSKARDTSQKRANIVFGDSIQVMYKLENCESINSATLIFHDVENTDIDTSNSSAKKRRLVPASFEHLKKLSHRIIVWCFEYDSDNPNSNIIPCDGGFPRLEMIPLTLLFKENE